jgi:hypothetical protein
MALKSCDGINPPHDARYSQLGHSHGGGSEAFPVGSFYSTSQNANPAALLGYGTWIRRAQGRMLIGLDEGDPDFDTPGKTGGVKSVGHSGAAVAQHAAGVTGQASAGTTQRGTTADTLTKLVHTHTTPALAHSVTQPGGHSVLNPFFVCYIWERTA